jgi:hypothetical protein
MLDFKTRLQCVEELVINSFEGTINVGDTGEIVASLLLLFAFDSAHYQQCGIKLYPQKVRLGDFTSRVVVDTNRQGRQSSIPVDITVSIYIDSYQLFIFFIQIIA